MKSNIIRITVILLSLLMLVSCAGPGGNNDGTTAGGSENPAGEDSTTAEPGAEEKLADFIGGESKAVLVRPSKCSDAIKEDVLALRDKINQKAAFKPEMHEDIEDKGNTESFEILIGDTEREASKALIASLPEHGFGVKITDKKVVIAGTDDTMTALAIYHFYNNIMKKAKYVAKGKMTLPVGYEHIEANEDFVTAEQKLLSTKYDVKAFTASKSYFMIQRRENYTDSQGVTYDGKYFYAALKKSVDGVEWDIIVKYDPVEKKEVLVSEDLPLDHCNDLCYNSKLKQVVAVNMNGDLVTFIDPETLTVAEQKHVPYFTSPSPYGISYNEADDTYAFLYFGITILDSNFNRVKVVSLDSRYDKLYTAQGMDRMGDIFFVPKSYKTESPEKNTIIMVYTKDGGYLRTVKLDQTNEIETMVNYDGRFWATFNFSGARIYEITFEIVFN